LLALKEIQRQSKGRTIENDLKFIIKRIQAILNINNSSKVLFKDIICSILKEKNLSLKNYQDIQFYMEIKYDFSTNRDIIISILNRVLCNLITNSLEASPYKNKIYIRLYKQNSNSIFEVEDESGGVEKRYQEKIFSSTFSKGIYKNKNNHGLGLNICQSLLKSVDSLIAYEKTKKGSIFKVTIPIDQF